MYSCTHWLRPLLLPTPPPHLGSYTRAPLVSQDRRHLFVTPCFSHSRTQFSSTAPRGKMAAATLHLWPSRTATWSSGTRLCSCVQQTQLLGLQVNQSFEFKEVKGKLGHIILRARGWSSEALKRFKAIKRLRELTVHDVVSSADR